MLLLRYYFAPKVAMAHRTMSQLEQDKRDLRREEERKLSRMEEQRRRSDELWRVKEKKTMQRAFCLRRRARGWACRRRTGWLH